MFQIGMHVICVDAETHEGWTYSGGRGHGSGLNGLQCGRVYTVADLYLNGVGHPCVVLAEIKRPYKPGRGYRRERFRPLSSDRLSIFRQHLAPLSTDKVEA